MTGSNGLLKEKICVVTGTNRGIGQKIAELFAQEGAIVYASARSAGCLDAWACEISAETEGKIVPVYFDITDAQGIKQTVMRLKEEQGRVDVLVNNAGVVSNERLGMVSADRLRKLFEVNVFGLFEITQLIATRFMVKQKSGSIINMASVVGVEGAKGQAAYSASKGAVVALTKSLAKELAEYNIRVNAIAPGMIATDRLQDTITEVYKGKIPAIGMGRLGKPEEVAEACLYFASDKAAYTTGQILTVAGDIIL